MQFPSRAKRLWPPCIGTPPYSDRLIGEPLLRQVRVWGSVRDRASPWAFLALPRDFHSTIVGLRGTCYGAKTSHSTAVQQPWQAHHDTTLLPFSTALLPSHYYTLALHSDPIYVELPSPPFESSLYSAVGVVLFGANVSSNRLRSSSE